MPLLGLLASGFGRKVMIVGGVAVAVLLVVAGIYRAGGKAAAAAGTRRALDRTIRNIRTRQDVELEIARDNRDGVRAVDRLRADWSRD